MPAVLCEGFPRTARPDHASSTLDAAGTWSPYSAESIQSIIDEPLGAGVSVNQCFLFVAEKLELETSSWGKGAILAVDSQFRFPSAMCLGCRCFDSMSVV